MTPKQKVLARHALGLDNPDAKGKSYRNWYFIGASGVKHDEWQAMEAAGEAEFHLSTMTTKVNSTGLYVLTRKGAELALRPGETLDPEDFP